ncbi:LysR substrate-binding domain-containing protein [Bradyrhizobium tropiciagri]|uniref:LysR substrate-binding domain-containing protein n=1 Tax=Bradyrhizobium tropiciagri TaxID=312253 RepID=UPI001FCD8CE5|nr:LysR substrate-binding domain-containing protein [Bradyrhizobium tropiciagri]
MAVFVRVADTGSFTTAAKELRLSPTMIGKHIRFLEARLGSSLINRSTRRQQLTELGRNCLDHCRHLLEEAEAGDALAEETLRTPRGKLRVAAPAAFGAYGLTPAIVKFMQLYPEVSVELLLSDGMADLFEGSVDVAIRVGALNHSTMIARSLSPFRQLVCASPDYLAANGVPKHPTDLQQHDCMAFSGWMDGPGWTFYGPEGEIYVEVKSRLQINNAFGIRHAALSGAGLAMLRLEFVNDDLDSGRLVRVLSDYKTLSRPHHLVWLQSRRVTPKLRAFIDYIAERYG